MMMNNQNPTVSIGIPVFNGENFLADAIESVLGQTYTDFELIISDNASTDNTQSICEKYARLDNRVKYFRNQKNLGAAPNFNCAFHLSSGKYFKWLAHDDVIHKNYLEQFVSILDCKPEIILCTSKLGIIDTQGKVVDEHDIELKTDSSNPVTRFYSLLMDWHLCFDIFGLIRREEMPARDPMGGYSHGDGVLLADLALRGRFYQIPEVLFFARRHENQSMLVFGNWGRGERFDYHSYAEWFDVNNKDKFISPTWRIVSEYAKIIRNSPNNIKTIIFCYLALGRWTIRNRIPLLVEIIQFGHYFLSKTKKQLMVDNPS